MDFTDYFALGVAIVVGAIFTTMSLKAKSWKSALFFAAAFTAISAVQLTILNGVPDQYGPSATSYLWFIRMFFLAVGLFLAARALHWATKKES